MALTGKSKRSPMTPGNRRRLDRIDDNRIKKLKEELRRLRQQIKKLDAREKELLKGGGGKK